MNELDKEINIANSNLNSANTEKYKLNDINVNLKERLAMSTAQSKILAENKIDLETELENADTELNILKIQHNKIQKSIADANAYQNNLENDLRDVKESTNSALKENDKLKSEQDKLYEIQLNKLNEYNGLLATIAQLQVSEGTDQLDIYPPRFDRSQADINVTLKSLTHCADKYKTTLE